MLADEFEELLLEVAAGLVSLLEVLEALDELGFYVLGFYTSAFEG
jgi:hypothetical protein